MDTYIMAQARYVEIGRVVYVNFGPEQGKLSVIVDVIDANRALVDGPSTGVLRQQMPFSRISLTEFVLPIKRNQKTASVGKIFDAEEVIKKWNSSHAGTHIAARLRRASLTDLERFKLMVAQKKKSLTLKKELKKLKPKH
jgi:large subunit ribosomal protein L14e